MAGYGSSAVSGAGAGAAAGTAVMPGWGTAIGGVLGLGAGLLSAYEEDEEAKKKLRALKDAETNYNRQMENIARSINEYYDNPSNFIGQSTDVDAYRKLLADYNPNDYVYNFGDFNFGHRVSDYINPYYDKIIEATTKGVQQSAAGSALGRSTGAAEAIAAAEAKKNDELYKTALSEYNTDRSQAYQEYADNITRNQARLNQLKAARDSQIATAGNLATDYTNTQLQRQQDLANQQMAATNGTLNFAGLKVGV